VQTRIFRATYTAWWTRPIVLPDPAASLPPLPLRPMTLFLRPGRLRPDSCSVWNGAFPDPTAASRTTALRQNRSPADVAPGYRLPAPCALPPRRSRPPSSRSGFARKRVDGAAAGRHPLAAGRSGMRMTAWTELSRRASSLGPTAPSRASVGPASGSGESVRARPAPDERQSPTTRISAQQRRPPPGGPRLAAGRSGWPATGPAARQPQRPRGASDHPSTVLDHLPCRRLSWKARVRGLVQGTWWCYGAPAWLRVPPLPMPPSTLPESDGGVCVVAHAGHPALLPGFCEAVLHPSSTQEGSR